MLRNFKMHDSNLHLEIFMRLCELASKKHKIGNYLLEVNSITGEIVWGNKSIDIFATPFIYGDNISFYIINAYYIEKESVSLRNEKRMINNKELSMDEFIEIYLNIVRKKLIEWKL